MNADGISDLVLFSGLNDSFALIATGKGDGSFSSPIGFPLSSSSTPGIVSWAATDLALGDFNGDGNIDLAGIATTGDYVAILFGDGKGGTINDNVSNPIYAAGGVSTERSRGALNWRRQRRYRNRVR